MYWIAHRLVSNSCSLTSCCMFSGSYVAIFALSSQVLFHHSNSFKSYTLCKTEVCVSHGGSGSLNFNIELSFPRSKHTDFCSTCSWKAKLTVSPRQSRTSAGLTNLQAANVQQITCQLCLYDHFFLSGFLFSATAIKTSLDFTPLQFSVEVM